MQTEKEISKNPILFVRMNVLIIEVITKLLQHTGRTLCVCVRIHTLLHIVMTLEKRQIHSQLGRMNERTDGIGKARKNIIQSFHMTDSDTSGPRYILYTCVYRSIYYRVHI